MKEYEMFIELLMRVLFRTFRILRKYEHNTGRNIRKGKRLRLGTLQAEDYQNGGGAGNSPPLPRP